MGRTFIAASMAYVALVILILELLTGSQGGQVNTSSGTIPTYYAKADLLEAIQSYADRIDEAPMDAKLDPVWKLVPGYNGIKVNVEESFLAMWPEQQFQEERIVYEEISPSIHFSHLMPAPIYKGNPNKPALSFLINVAWGNEFIEPILHILKKHHLKVTFFFDGSWVKKNPNLAKQIADAGHEIGNHAYHHPDLSTYSRQQTKEELLQTNEIIQKTLQLRPQWFAPPSGSFKQETVEVAYELGMYTILWTVDTIDWRNPNPHEMVDRVVSEVHPGAMILMHPTKATAQGIEQMIVALKEKGYSIETVSTLFAEKRSSPHLQPAH